MCNFVIDEPLELFARERLTCKVSIKEAWVKRGGARLIVWIVIWLKVGVRKCLLDCKALALSLIHI